MATDIQLYPETRVAYVVGTNVAFLDPRHAALYVQRNCVTSQSSISLANDSATPEAFSQPCIMMLPLGYLAKDTQVVFGDVPPHKPATKAAPGDATQQAEPEKDAEGPSA